MAGSDDDLVDRANIDPVGALRGIQASVRKLEAGHQRKLRDKVVGAFAAALVLVEKPDEWSALLLEPFWGDAKKRPKEGDIDNALWWSMYFAFDGREPHAYNRVSKYATALEAAFQNRWSPQQLSRAIDKAGGIEPLYNASKKTRIGEIPVDQTPEFEEEEEEEEEVNDSRASDGSQDYSAGRSASHALRSKIKRTKVDEVGLEAIEILMTRKRSKRLSRMVELGEERANITVRRVADNGKWPQYRATHLTISKVKDAAEEGW